MGKVVFWSQSRRRYSIYRKTNKRAAKTKRSSWGGEHNIKKSDCHIHATREERLNAVHALRFQHRISTLCRVLRVNRSTYYKHFSNKVSDRAVMNQKIRKCILSIYTASKKRPGAGKICYLLYVEYGIKISVGRVYRLMKSMDLPKIAETKPKYRSHKTENE